MFDCLNKDMLLTGNFLYHVSPGQGGTQLLSMLEALVD